ncbi:MAG: PKD domain-containing protein, partial [Bacteroidales bacterium]|nr:PKD domain-containing protein [Bacteroidales bacterium]
IIGQCYNNFQYAVNNLTVDFFGMAFPPNSTYTWDFGDGAVGTGQNVIHTYAGPGLYPVALTTTGPNGCTFTSTQMVLVSGNPGNCHAMFFHHPDSLNQLGLHFMDVSTPIPDTWAWDFGDGTTANIPNPYHVFSASGVYHVCLTITKGTPGTISFCTDTYCENVFVNSNPTGGKIHGTITMGFGFADHARVFLIVFDPVANTLTAVDTVFTQNNPQMPGYYEFLNVQPGTYLVKAALTPNSVSYADFMPTYYINTLWWDYGSDVIVNNQWVIADINLIAGSNPGGPGFIGGNVTQGANKLLGPGDAIPDVEILLLSMNDDPHLYTYSDVNGDYEFSNLAYGTYKIWAEVLDKTTIPVIVTIDANNPSITDIDLVVTSTGVTTSIDDNISAFIENISDIYPNPVNDEMNVEVSLKQSSELQFEVFNQIGQIVYSKTVSESAGQHVVKINTSDFDGGVYSLRITTKDKAQIMRKFVKVD